MKLAELQHGQVVKYRVGRAGRTAPDWSEWRTSPIFLRRREKEYRRGKTVYPVGQILELVIENEPNWATYCWTSFCPPSQPGSNAIFLAEDYYLEIEGLEP